MTEKWVAIGDINAMQHGSSWLKQINEEGTEFEIVKWEASDETEDHGFFSHCVINVDDSWIKVDSVKSFIDFQEETDDNMTLANGIFDFYGNHCGGSYRDYITSEQAIKYLHHQGIEVEV